MIFLFIHYSLPPTIFEEYFQLGVKHTKMELFGTISIRYKTIQGKQRKNITIKQKVRSVGYVAKRSCTLYFYFLYLFT